MHPMLTIATRAARSAGDIMLRASEELSRGQQSNQGNYALTSEIDRRAEQEIISIIRNSYPEHAILAEESGKHEGNEYLWIIDPLDGSTNFMHGFPQYAVSIALQYKGKIEVGVIYDPLHDELFTASRGGGAMLNNRRLRVTNQKSLQGCLLGTGFPFKRQQHIDAYLAMFKALVTGSAGIRRAGCSALDLAYVAAGRFDGFWEIGLRPWDMAAGTLLIQEAGGVITDFAFNDQYLSSGNIIAGNPKLHLQIYRSIEAHIPDNLKKKL